MEDIQMKTLTLLTALLTLIPVGAHASIQAFDDNVELGHFSEMNCTSGIECSQVSGKLQVRASTDTDQVDLSGGDTTMTTSQCGYTFVNSASACLDLPDAGDSDGCRVTVILGASSEFTIAPATGDKILLLTDATSDAIKADAQGESIVLESIDSTNWAPVGSEKGTWSDVD